MTAPIEWHPALRFSNADDAWIARLDGLPALQLHRNRSDDCWFLMFGGVKWRLHCESTAEAKVRAVRTIRSAIEAALLRLNVS